MNVDDKKEEIYFEHYNPKELQKVIDTQTKVISYIKNHKLKELHSIRIYMFFGWIIFFVLMFMIIPRKMNSASTATLAILQGVQDLRRPQRFNGWSLENPENPETRSTVKHPRSPLRGTASFGEERRFPTATTGKNANNA